MTLGQVVIALGVLVVVVAYAALAVRWTSSGRQSYASLRRPSWQPPDAVFGVVWPLSFLTLAVAGVGVAAEGPPRDALVWTLLLAASVAMALGWAHEFYVAQRLSRAAVLLAGASVLTWGLVAVTVDLVPWAGWLITPYAVWLSLATTLAFGYWRLADRGESAPA